MTKFGARDAVLSRNTTGTTYVTIGQVMEIGEIGAERDLNDASVYGESWKDFVLGQQEGTEFDMKLAYDPADTSHVALEGDYATSVVKKYHLAVLPATKGVEFSAILTSLKYGAPRDGVYSLTLGMKIVNPGVTTYTTP